ncbi:MAG: lipid-A-disaccharide synthase N-terminal domain-containing protein [Nitrospira sp.]|nr:lipid-A-disaccharide synthase N-terminal domain-containing protein [Nitrospira sp.]
MRVSPIAHDGSIMNIETIWLGIGFLGQGMFFGRWVIQWITSEKKAESQVPISFWYMSLIGGLITLAYAIYRKDPVFIAGQSIGTIVYIRNLMLISRASQANRPINPS